MISMADKAGMFEDFTGLIHWHGSYGIVRNATFELIEAESYPVIYRREGPEIGPPHGARIVWHGGEWLDGNWHDGDWHGGIWHDGAWNRGSWHGGQWLGGVWHGGTGVNGVYSAEAPV